jgi:hypothetical protein
VRANSPQEILRPFVKRRELHTHLRFAFPDNVTPEQHSLAFPFGMKLTFLANLGKSQAFEAATRN